MKSYEIMITGHGVEMVYGRMTEAQYEYWNDRPEEMTGHLFDPESGEEVTEEDDPRYLGEWNELDDLDHAAANNACACELCVIDEDGNCLIELDIEQFIEENNCKITEQEFDLASMLGKDGDHYVFQGVSQEKGCFHHATLELPDGEDFDPGKMEFTTRRYPNGEVLIEDLLYKGEQLGNESEGDSEVKGQEFEILKLRVKDGALELANQS